MQFLRNAPRRIVKSFSYCWDGLRDVFRCEESFRLEALCYPVLLAAMLLLRWPVWKILFMSASYLLIPLMETINSAIENICDLVSPWHSRQVKRAKDKGALAVLFAIVVNLLVLFVLLSV